MSHHESNVALRQMLDHACEARAIVAGKSKREFEQDRLLNLATVRLLEIVGEAANRIPRSERERYLDIPWYEIIGFRNRVIHGYDAVDLDIVWRTLKDDLPRLIAALEKLVAER
jgi:uncharacterized protein with HEPN domain